MALFLPQRWRSQLPTPDAGVDWSNPLTLGLRNLWNMAGRGVRDATGAANGTPIGGGGLLATTDGLGANFDSSGTTYIDLARPNQFNLASGSQWSMMFRVRTTTDTAQALFHYGDGTVNNRFVLYVGNGVTGTLTDELITFGRLLTTGTATPIAGYTTGTRAELVDGAIHTVMLTSNGSAVAIYLDGISRTVTVGSGSQNGRIDLGGATATTATIGVQNIGTIGAKFNGQMTFGAFWAADVSRYALELHRNPWQLFRPANSPVFYSLPSASGISVNLSSLSVSGNFGILTPSLDINLSNPEVVDVIQGNLKPELNINLVSTSIFSVIGSVVSSRNIPLTSLSISASSGSLVPVLTIPVVGESASFAQGVLSVSGSVNVNLTGLSFSSNNGSLTAALALSLLGQSVTSSLGSLVPNLQVGATGQASSLAIGNLVSSLAVPLSGNNSTFAFGTLTDTQGAVVNLSGLSFAGTSGSLSADLAISLLGQNLTISEGSIAGIVSGKVPVAIDFVWKPNEVRFIFGTRYINFDFD